MTDEMLQTEYKKIGSVGPYFCVFRLRVPTSTIRMGWVVVFGHLDSDCPLDAVAIPLESVTVSLESVTVNEASIRTAISPMPPSPSQLADVARSVQLPKGERLAALAKVQDQDVLFYLMFKLDCDTNLAVRVAAMASMVETVLNFARERQPHVFAARCPGDAERAHG
ncbi:MAG: hypothetical protein ACI4RA_03190 [Kiritimatiellia bacterium]